MTSRTLIASLVAVFAAVGFGTDHALAAEPYVTGTRVISSDATARVVRIQVSKAVVINLAGDIDDVLVADAKIANAIVRTKHRVFIIGLTVGQTNVYFFDAEGRQIDGLDIAVRSGPQPSPPPSWKGPAEARNVIMVYRGVSRASISCTPTNGCMATETPDTATKTESVSDTTIHNTQSGASP